MINIMSLFGKKITSIIFANLFLYLICTPILEGCYAHVQQLNSYFTLSTPYITNTKYIILPLFILFYLYKKLDLTRFGQIFFPVSFIVLMFLGLFTIFHYNTTDEERIVSQRTLIRHTYGWGDVEQIKVYAQKYSIISFFGKEVKIHTRTQRDNGTRYKHDYEYRIYLKDGRSINAWDDLDSVYRLDQFVKEKQIPIEYDVDETLFITDNEEHIKNANSIFGH